MNNAIELNGVGWKVEALRAFWTSEDAVETAFETAFGVSVEMWVMSWIDRNFDEIRRGPALTQSARFGGLLVIMLCGLIAGLWGRGRRVA